MCVCFRATHQLIRGESDDLHQTVRGGLVAARPGVGAAAIAANTAKGQPVLQGSSAAGTAEEEIRAREENCTRTVPILANRVSENPRFLQIQDGEPSFGDAP